MIYKISYNVRDLHAAVNRNAAIVELVQASDD